MTDGSWNTSEPDVSSRTCVAPESSIHDRCHWRAGMLTLRRIWVAVTIVAALLFVSPRSAFAGECTPLV